MTQNLSVVRNEHLFGEFREGYLVAVPDLNCQLQAEVVGPLLSLCERASAAGFDIKVASSFRSFDRQLMIWNGKASGLRSVLDTDGQPLDVKRLSDVELMFAILRWSALPGASRHHWGTDLDIYDASNIPENYILQLTVAETQGEGPFTAFHEWLTAELATENNVGFYRPYDIDRGGVAPEPWHLSYAPLAEVYEQALTEDILRERIQQTDILLKDNILEHLSEIYQRFVQLI